MSNYNPAFKKFAQEQMRSQGESIKRWATQTENPLLQELAVEVIQAAAGQTAV